MDLLESPIRPYAWGSVTAIPELLGREPDGEPQAEQWLGAHPAAPSTVQRGGVQIPLDEVVAADPAGELGPEVARAYDDRLPFLLKLLAAAEPLSLQAHPTRAQALAGYAREESRRIALDAPERSYRDRNHKPELLLALTTFEALCGFRPVAETLELLAALGVDELDPDLVSLRSQPDAVGLKAVVERWLRLEPEACADLVAAVAKAAAGARTPYERELATVADLAERYPGDAGVVCALLLNRVTLQPDEAVFLAAGNLHAYLHGLGIEVMASSDNVVRGGFTSKHVDVDELLAVVDFTPGPPALVVAVRDGAQLRYDVPVPDFRLSRIDLATGRTVELPAAAPQILLPLQGSLELRHAGEVLTAANGVGVFVPAFHGPDGSGGADGAGIAVELSGTARVFRVTSAPAG